jgi:hypothetical protein
MTTPVTAASPRVLAPTRDELIRALRKRHPRMSQQGLAKLLDRRLANGTIDVILNQAGDIDVRPIGAIMRR